MIINSCTKLILLLTCIVAVLQITHLVLLNHLETLRSQKNKVYNNEPVLPPEKEAKIIYEQYENVVNNKHVLDSSRIFRISNLADAVKPLIFSAPVADITLVTHCSFNHLQKLVALAKRWQGPISIAVFSEVEDVATALWRIASLQVLTPGIKENVTFSLVSPVPEQNEMQPTLPAYPVLDASNASEDEHFENYAAIKVYPNNLLRNVARRTTFSEFFLALDIDMMPNENLRQDFLLFANKKGLFRKNRHFDKTVFVLPVFEAKESVSPPHNKAQLLSLIEIGEVRPFYAHVCVKCQAPTNYEAWLDEPPGSELAPLFDVLWKDPWEPFFIASNNVPLYDERFRQYGFNRISQVCELHVAGYTFSVMNNAFLIHLGFKTTESFHLEKDSDQENNRLLFRKFKMELKYKYIDSSRRCY